MGADYRLRAAPRRGLRSSTTGRGPARAAAQAPDAAAVQAFDPVAHGRHHALDLVVFALQQGQAQVQGLGIRGRALRQHPLGRVGSHGRGVIVQHHALEQLVAHGLRDGVLASDLVHLGHVLLGRGQLVQQRAVVGQQQQARGVLVQAPDRLQATPTQGHGQQVVHARPGTRLERALVACRLVQHHQGLHVCHPRLPIDHQAQAVGWKRRLRVVHHLTLDLHQAVEDQAIAHAALAEALVKKDVGKVLMAGRQAGSAGHGVNRAKGARSG